MSEQRVEAVERALSLIEAFSAQETELSLAQLHEATGLYKSTILRLAGSLERYGYLVRKPSGYYRIGPSLWRLGSIYSRSFELGDLIRPELKALVGTTRETASFYVQEGHDRVCLYRENSPEALRFHLDEGARLPMERGASAHILRAFGPDQPADLQHLRKAGFCVTDSERSPQIAAIAVPVFGEHKILRGALALSGPSFRFEESERLAALKLLQSAAERLRCQ